MTNKKIEHYPWYIRLIFWHQKKKYGHILNSTLLWAKSPRVFIALSWLYTSLLRKGSPISPALRSFIIVRVSQINGCPFCVDLNTSVLMQLGIDVNKVQSLATWQKSPLFDAKEKLVLEYVEAVTSSTQEISAKLRKIMRAQFTQEELVEITAVIAFQSMSTKFNNAFGVEPQGFCSLMQKPKQSLNDRL